MASVNWQNIGHIAVGTIITGCQAVALADPDPKVVSWCHIITLVAIQLGVSLGVWTVSQFSQARKDLLLMQGQKSAPTPVLAHEAREAPKDEKPAS